MKFKHGTRRRALEYEKDWVKRWKEDKTFEKSVENRTKDNSYVFYDGPPFISGVPHHGTLLSSIVKDAVPRYQTMKGKRVERVWGWDCHGLPAERFTEKKLGIHSRQEVVEYGIEKYINATRENMVQTSSEWEDVVDRIGRWVDFKGAYKTMDKTYMESVWWAFKALYEKGKIYEGEKVLMYCTLDGTPLSKAEVTMDAGAYQDITDPSVYVKFKLEDGRCMLAWTTTPWTLPANTALAVNKKVDYVEVEIDSEHIIVAKALAEKIFTDGKHQPLEYKIVKEYTGEDFIGLEYEPLFGINRGDNAHKIWNADYVETEAGTGIVHLAPAYGEEDFALAKEMGIPVVHTIDQNGFFTEGDWKGANIWEVNKQIAKELKERGIVWKIDYIRHSYPHCHRCGTKLMYRAHPSWFMDINAQRSEMLEKNEPINWFPEHLKYGRFNNTIRQAPDWNISRDRFWATAMPVWKSDSGTVKVFGSYDELKAFTGIELDDYHRPWIDELEFDAIVEYPKSRKKPYEGIIPYDEARWQEHLAYIEENNRKDPVDQKRTGVFLEKEHFKRIDRVMDSWFEAGSMPFAQFHYPFENKEKFETNFPGDFIVEYIGQTRAWFYYMHAVSVALFDDFSFKNVITTGTLAGNDGRKMSKSYGNFTDPNELMDKFSADSLRFLLLSSPVLNGEDFSLQDKEVGDVARKLSMIWNMYDFFTMYAEVDGWEFDGRLVDPLTGSEVSSETASRPFAVDLPSSDHGAAFVSSRTASPVSNPLDIWIVSRLHQLVDEVELHMDTYNIPDALSPILPFLDDASNWFVRRSRRRFWKSEDDNDKNDAYRTLHYVLVRLAYVLAPFTPFLAEELYHNLTGDKESIHLKDWLAAGEVNEPVVEQMTRTRELINNGLGIRMKKDETQESVKVRQPLQQASYAGMRLEEYYEQIIAEELNVKEVRHIENLVEHLAAYDTTSGPIDAKSWMEISNQITPELRREGLMREVIRYVQAARKNAGLNVDDRIRLGVTTDDEELKQAMFEHADTIEQETLAESIQDGDMRTYEETVKVEGKELVITFTKKGE